MKKSLLLLSLLVGFNSQIFAGCVPEDKEEVEAAKNFLNEIQKENLIKRFLQDKKLPNELNNTLTFKSISSDKSDTLIYDVILDKSKYIQIKENTSGTANNGLRQEIKRSLCKNAFSYVMMEKGVKFHYNIFLPDSSKVSEIEINGGDCRSTPFGQ